MTRRDVRAFLFDIEHACSSVADFTTNKTLSDYLAEPMLRSAVERQFEIIGAQPSAVGRPDASVPDH